MYESHLLAENARTGATVLIKHVCLWAGATFGSEELYSFPLENLIFFVSSVSFIPTAHTLAG